MDREDARAAQLVLETGARPVVVTTPTAEDLRFSVTPDVVGGAQARRNLLPPSEVEGVLQIVGPEGRYLLVLGTDTEIERQVIADRPLVLRVERLDVAAGLVGDTPVV